MTNLQSINIRSAGSNDAPALASMRLELRSRGERNVESDTAFLDRCTRWMTCALQQSNWRCWVAEEQWVVVGSLWLQLIDKVPNPTSESETFAYITNFFICEPARGKGLGSRMLNEALAWCREQSLELVILWPSEKSRSLYLRHGFAVRDDLMALVLRE